MPLAPGVGRPAVGCFACGVGEGLDASTYSSPGWCLCSVHSYRIALMSLLTKCLAFNDHHIPSISIKDIY